MRAAWYPSSAIWCWQSCPSRKSRKPKGSCCKADRYPNISPHPQRRKKWKPRFFPCSIRRRNGAPTAGNPLEGISFTLIDAQNGTVTAHAVSDEKDEFEIAGFTVDDWILREDEAPEGFNLMNDYPFHVGYNWKNDQTVTLVNIPNHYELEKTDHRRKPLSGVRFGLYDDKGTFIRELVSDENGIVRADNLVPGSYLIRETRPLDGYARTDEEITFTIDESYIPPQKLARITNTSVIQTGVDFPVTPTMIVGLLMMTASVLLGLMRLLKKKHR